MIVSLRTRFILISTSLTLMALLLLTSVLYQQAIKYKHKQEIKNNRVLADQFHTLATGIDDFVILKKAISENISSAAQPAILFAIMDAHRNINFFYAKHDLKETTLETLLPDIKKSMQLREGQIENNENHYYWIINDLYRNVDNKKYSILIIYPLSSIVWSEVRQFFGVPFFITSFLILWLMVWASIILSSFVNRLEKQKHVLRQQSLDLEKVRDEALQANSAKSDFLTNMSHEIRTPLTSIIGFAETCLEIDQTIKERLKATKTIIKNSKYLLHIINEVLDLSKIEAGKLELELVSVSLIEVIDEVKHLVSIMADDKGLFFEVNYTYPIPKKIITDPLRLKQILINICVNAIKFTDTGHVYLNVSYLQDSSDLIFEVVDTGIGMSEQQIEKIFKPFEQVDNSATRKFSGTGLGLTISMLFAEMLKGEIFVESKENKGSRFTLKLKIVEAENSGYISDSHDISSTNFTSETKLEIPKLNAKILLVEDNKDIQDLVKILLKRYGIDLEVVANGELGVEAAMAANFDLVFMDIQMPVMDGLSAMRELKERAYTVPIIAMTANVMQKDRNLYNKVGFSGYLSKPINRYDLYSVLMEYLKSNIITSSEKKLLTSSLLYKEPNFIDLVDKFISRLPAMRVAINHAYTNKDTEKLSNLIHQMKGVGGGYGYFVLTDLCSKIEYQIESNDREKINILIEDFNTMVEEILAGKEENHKIVENIL